MRIVLFLIVVTALMFFHIARWISPPSSRNAGQWTESADPPAIEQTGTHGNPATTD